MGIFDFLKGKTAASKDSLQSGMEKTRSTFLGELAKMVLGKSSIDDKVLDELEELLIRSDVGVDTTLKIISRIQTRVQHQKYANAAELDAILREEIEALLQENTASDATNMIPPDTDLPYVIMVVGVNGAGKTTTIGKLAHQLTEAGKKVVLGAGDTFRAAAVDQLKTWGERAGVPVIDHGMNTDPAAVAFDAIKKGVEMGADVVIVDTAGRLHNKVNLMQELSKIKRVMQKVHAPAPHEVLLVLDGSTGQNAMNQAREFSKATEVTALAITKLDGTAKGGVVIGISDQLSIPVKYIGVGERVEDLLFFNRSMFVDSVFSKS